MSNSISSNFRNTHFCHMRIQDTSNTNQINGKRKRFGAYNTTFLFYFSRIFLFLLELTLIPQQLIRGGTNKRKTHIRKDYQIFKLRNGAFCLPGTGPEVSDMNSELRGILSINLKQKPTHLNRTGAGPFYSWLPKYPLKFLQFHLFSVWVLREWSKNKPENKIESNDRDK